MIVKICFEKEKLDTKLTMNELDNFCKLINFMDDNKIEYELDPPSIKFIY